MDFFKRHIILVSLLALAVFLAGGYFFAFSPPSSFSSKSIVVIARGTSVSDIAGKLSSANIIRNPTILHFILRIFDLGGKVQAGSYLFDSPENLLVIAYRLTTGDYGLPPVSVTFPEGTTVRDMSERISEALPLIHAQDFISAGKSHEGYLFPDTYFFPHDTTVESVIEAMLKNFDAKIASISYELEASGRSLSDVIVMSSLIEKEARTDASKRIIAGILWKRLELGMPLQVDAVFGYINNRDTYSPSYADLKIDSPYNTYIHTGLPPGPIANPGLASIQAVLNPTKTDYLYYLTGKDGMMRYATTYAGHQANRRKYLD